MPSAASPEHHPSITRASPGHHRRITSGAGVIGAAASSAPGLIGALEDAPRSEPPHPAVDARVMRPRASDSRVRHPRWHNLRPARGVSRPSRPPAWRTRPRGRRGPRHERFLPAHVPPGRPPSGPCRGRHPIDRALGGCDVRTHVRHPVRMAVRTNLMLPPELVAEVDRIAGPRNERGEPRRRMPGRTRSPSAPSPRAILIRSRQTRAES